MKLLHCCAVLASVCAMAAQLAWAAADLVFTNGIIHTHDAATSVVSAVAIQNGRFVYVGNDAGAAAQIGPTTTVEDLQQRMALPGLIDSHMHPTMTVIMKSGVVVTGETVQAYLQCIQQYYAANTGLTFVAGMGWMNVVVPSNGPTSKELDSVVSNIPAAIISGDGHSMWLNTLALQQSGIAAMKKDPPGGRIMRDRKTKKATGTIREWGAMLLVFQMLGQPPMEALLEPLKQQFAWFNSLGITTLHDAGLMYDMMNGVTIAALEELARRGELTVRVRGAAYLTPYAKVKDTDAVMAKVMTEVNKHTNALFQMRTAKFLVDGVVEGRTALLEKPYLVDKPKQKGLRMWKPAVLKKATHAVHALGLQAHFHGIGDGATHAALDALQYSAKHGGGNHRDLITHLELVRPSDIPRFASLNVIAVPQPVWGIQDDLYPLEVSYLGQYRADHQYPLRSFLNAGVLLASASDFPAAAGAMPDPNPMLGMQVAVARWLPDFSNSPPYWVEEAISLTDVLYSYTINGAYANFLEGETGSIVVGKAADFVVLDGNLYTRDPRTICDVKVVKTLLCGKTVFPPAGAAATR